MGAINAQVNAEIRAKLVNAIHDYVANLIKNISASDGQGTDGRGSSGPFVYRGLAAGEDPSIGIVARDPNATNSPLSHVAGKKLTQWISTTKDYMTAIEKYGKNGGVMIDLSKVKTQVVDVSGGFPGKGRVNAYAKKDQEVLVQKFIPAEAMQLIWPASSQQEK